MGLDATEILGDGRWAIWTSAKWQIGCYCPAGGIIRLLGPRRRHCPVATTWENDAAETGIATSLVRRRRDWEQHLLFLASKCVLYSLAPQIYWPPGQCMLACLVCCQSSLLSPRLRLRLRPGPPRLAGGHGHGTIVLGKSCFMPQPVTAVVRAEKRPGRAGRWGRGRPWEDPCCRSSPFGLVRYECAASPGANKIGPRHLGKQVADHVYYSDMTFAWHR